MAKQNKKVKSKSKVEIIDGNKLVDEMCCNFWNRRTQNEKIVLSVGAAALIGYMLAKLKDDI